MKNEESTNPEVEELLKTGGYAKKQIYAGCNVLRWSHRQRFSKGLSLIKKYSPSSILDYGCGDGTFLILAKDIVKEKNGMEIDDNQLRLLKDRLKDEPDFNFHHTNDILETKSDMVTCFEVLEHCTKESIENVLTSLKKNCTKGGTVIISVPKETGLTMVGKQTVRRILGWRKFGNYEWTESYNFVDFFKMLFATEKTQVPRKYYEVEFDGGKYETCGHYAFNWKSLKLDIQRHFEIEKIEYTPFVLPLGVLSSQVWFICKNN